MARGGLGADPKSQGLVRVSPGVYRKPSAAGRQAPQVQAQQLPAVDPNSLPIGKPMMQPRQTFGGGFFRDRGQDTDHMGNFPNRAPQGGGGMGIAQQMQQFPQGQNMDPGRYPGQAQQMQQGQGWSPQAGTFNPALQQQVNFAPGTQNRLQQLQQQQGMNQGQFPVQRMTPEQYQQMQQIMMRR